MWKACICKEIPSIWHFQVCLNCITKYSCICCMLRSCHLPCHAFCYPSLSSVILCLCIIESIAKTLVVRVISNPSVELIVVDVGEGVFCGGLGSGFRLFRGGGLRRGSARAWCKWNKGRRRRGNIVLLAAAGIAVSFTLSPCGVII